MNKPVIVTEWKFVPGKYNFYYKFEKTTTDVNGNDIKELAHGHGVVPRVMAFVKDVGWCDFSFNWQAVRIPVLENGEVSKKWVKFRNKAKFVA